MSIKKILFRASGSGNLVTKKQGSTFTEVQKARIDELLYEKLNGVNLAGNKVKFFGTKKPEELETLISKRDAPPELSATAKAFIRKIWLKNEKGVFYEIKSKFLDKGIYNEEEGISLLSDVDGILYTKNEERLSNDDHDGECDIIKEINGIRIVQDVKLSWNCETFLSAEENTLYEWQGRVYMELFNAEEFWLRYCLVDCPDHLVQKEKEYAWRKYYSETMSEEEQADLETMMQPIYDQIDRNLVYSNNERFTKEERVKTFKFYRDKSKMDEMAEAVKLARIYYDTITLNGSN